MGRRDRDGRERGTKGEKKRTTVRIEKRITVKDEGKTNGVFSFCGHHTDGKLLPGMD